ncbi:hypothetical protein [Deinococcus radiophilus]
MHGLTLIQQQPHPHTALTDGPSNGLPDWQTGATLLAGHGMAER